MRTIQPITKYSRSRSTDLASDGVEEISVASRKVPAGVFTQFARNSQSARRQLISDGKLVS